MREERLEVSVTFDERGYIGRRTGTAAGCGGAQPGRPAPQDRDRDVA